MKNILFIPFFLLMFAAVAQTPDTLTPETKTNYFINQIKGKSLSYLPDFSLSNSLKAVSQMAAGRVPFLTMDEVRAGKADGAKTVQITDKGREGIFVYNPVDSISVSIGDSAMVIKSGGRVYIRNAEVINVKWFGAKGDGIADDTEAINKAIRYGKDVFIPQGIYLTSSAIILRGDIQITGSGKTTTKILANHSGDAMKWIGTGGSTTGSGYARNVILKDFAIQGNDTTASGIHFRWAFNWYISNVQVTDCINGFYGDSSGFFWRFVFVMTEAISCVNGYDFSLNSAMEAVPVSMIHPTARSCSGYGMIIRKSFVAFNISGGEFNSNGTGIGLFGAATKAVSIVGASFENNTTGIVIGDATDSPQINIQSCRFMAISPITGKKAIQIVKGKVKISYCTFNDFDSAISIATNATGVTVEPTSVYNVTAYITHNSLVYNDSNTSYLFTSTFVSSRSATELKVNSVVANSATINGKVTINSTTSGIVPPRMTTAERDNISPMEGEEIYNLTLHAKQFWDGTVWKTITTE